MATDLSDVASAKILTTTADEEITLDPAGVYILSNNGTQDVFFSTDGSTVVANTNTLVGQGMLPKQGTIFGLALWLADVATLKIRSAAATVQVTISRAAFIPATER
jgi:hypothetical protein